MTAIKAGTFEPKWDCNTIAAMLRQEDKEQGRGGGGGGPRGSGFNNNGDGIGVYVKKTGRCRWWQWQGQSGTSKDGGGCGVSKVGDGARGDDIFVFLLFLASEIKGKKLSIN